MKLAPQEHAEGIDNATTLARAEAAIAAGSRSLVNFALFSMVRCLWPRKRPAQAERVAVYRIGNLGDIACAVPALHAIRRAYPKARLVLVTSPGRRGMPGAADLLASVSWIDEIAAYHSEEIAGLGGQLRWISEMRARQFDMWIELSAVAAPLSTILRNIAAARMTGVKWASGWRYDRLRLFARAQSDLIDFPNESTRMMRIVSAAGFAQASSSIAAMLELGSRERDAVDRLFAAESIGSADLLALAPGAKAPPNRWPVDRFIEAGRYLADRGTRVVVLGSVQERDLCGRVAGAIGARASNLAGRASVRESCEILRRCALLVCNDSGVQHLAALIGTPSISIFSCRDFRGKWFPAGGYNVVLRKSVPCHTCFVETCPYDNRCIGLVTADEVIAASGQFLNFTQHSEAALAATAS